MTTPGEALGTCRDRCLRWNWAIALRCGLLFESAELTDLYLRFAFDLWMAGEHEAVPYERWGREIVVHCESEREALRLRSEIEARMAECRLKLEVAGIVYCKDSERPGSHEQVSFDFVGHTFCPRPVTDREGRRFTCFLPGPVGGDRLGRRSSGGFYGTGRDAQRTSTSPWSSFFGHYDFESASRFALRRIW